MVRLGGYDTLEGRIEANCGLVQCVNDSGSLTSVLKRVLKWKIKRCIRQTFSRNISDNLLGQEAAVYHLWSIGMYAGSSPHRIFPRCGISNPVLTRDHVTDARALFVADRFIIRKGDTWFMFF